MPGKISSITTENRENKSYIIIQLGKIPTINSKSNITTEVSNWIIDQKTKQVSHWISFRITSVVWWCIQPQDHDKRTIFEQGIAQNNDITTI